MAIKQGFGIFITMNPNIKDRVELPDNLKILFRFISFIKPLNE